MIKKQELQKLAQSALTNGDSESSVENQTDADLKDKMRNENQETNSELDDIKEQDHKKSLENQNTTGNLYISTKSSQSGDVNNLNSSHLIEIKQSQENNNSTPNKLTNGQTNNPGKSF